MSKAKAPENETAEERFLRLGTLRIAVVIDGLRLVENLAPDVPSREYAEQAFGAIDAAVAKMKAAWSTPATQPKGKPVFAFASPTPAPVAIHAPQQKAAGAKK